MGLDIPEGHHAIIFMQFLDWDLAEETITHCYSSYHGKIVYKDIQTHILGLSMLVKSKYFGR